MALQRDNYQNLLPTILIFMCIMFCLSLYTRTPVMNIRTFGRRGLSNVARYKQMRYTRDVVEAFPRVGEHARFTVTKVTNIASPVREKKVGKLGEALLFKTDILSTSNNNGEEANFIDDFLDKILTKNVISSRLVTIEDTPNNTPNYELIEMFLDLLLMVKIEESFLSSARVRTYSPQEKKKLKPLTIYTSIFVKLKISSN